MRISLIFLALSGFTYSLPNAEPGSMRNWFNSKSNSESKVPRKLAVKIGPSADVLELCNPNDEETPQFIDNDVFTGHVVVRVAGFNGIVKEGTEPISNPVYFNKKKRIYSIQVSGRFKEEFSADDVLFGAEFDNKIIMNFVKMIDPSLVADYKSNHPTFYSPLAAAINVMSAYPTSKPLLEYSDPVSKPSTPETIDYLGEWVWKQGFELKEGMSDLIGPVGYTPESRKKYFNNESNRNQIIFKKDMIYNFEIYGPYIDMNTFDVSLGMNINVKSYINYQPIRFTSKSRSSGKTFFAMEFELVKV